MTSPVIKQLHSCKCINYFFAGILIEKTDIAEKQQRDEYLRKGTTKNYEYGRNGETEKTAAGEVSAICQAGHTDPQPVAEHGKGVRNRGNHLLYRAVDLKHGDGLRAGQGYSG